MKVDKKKLVAGIQKFIATKKAELDEAKAALKTYERDIEVFNQKRRDFVLSLMFETKKPDAITASVSELYGNKYQTLTVSIKVPKSRIPKHLREEPENPKKRIEGHSYYAAGRWMSGGPQSEIDTAKEQLALIKLTPGDTVDVNTKQIMASIQPYLKYV